MPKLVFVVTDSLTAWALLRGQLAFLRSHGFEVVVVASPTGYLDQVAESEGVEVRPVPMAREIRPWADLRALVALRGTLRRLAPTIVNASTPKAGLLAMIAARTIGVPVRLYTLRGLRVETARGLRGRLLRTTERLTAALAHEVVCVSPSLCRRARELGIAPAGKLVSLGPGSSNGVDLGRFAAPPAEQLERLRSDLGIPAGAPVLGYVGRLTRDKGIEDLARIYFDRVLPDWPEARLLLVGDYEPGDPVSRPIRRLLDGDPRVVRPGFVDEPAPYYRLFDLLVFPSYREGFPNAPLEAAAAGIPVAGYAVTGTVDAVEHGETGLLAPAGNREALAGEIRRYLEDSALRARHGARGRTRVERHFQREIVWRRWLDRYRHHLAAGRA